MKKTLIVLAIAGAAVIALGAAGYAYAQDNLPPDAVFSFGSGFRGSWDGVLEESPPERGLGIRVGKGEFGFGFMGWKRGAGPLQEYFLPAFADSFDLSDGELATLQGAAEIMADVAEEYVPGSEEFHARMQEALTIALNEALADEVITQEQADRMLERIEQMPVGGFGSHGGFRRPVRRGGPQLAGMLKEYVQPAVAEAFGLTPDELQELHEEGVTLWSYAEDQGLTLEEFRTNLSEAFTNAVNTALEDGAITQERADQILERVEDFDGFGFGPHFRGPRW